MILLKKCVNIIFREMLITFSSFHLKDLLKELEEFAFKGIPDVRGCTIQDAQILHELVRMLIIVKSLSIGV